VAVLPRGGDAKDVRWFKGPARYALHTIQRRRRRRSGGADHPGANANPDPMYPNLDDSPPSPGAEPSIRRWTFDLGSKDDGFKEETVFAGSGFTPHRRPLHARPSRYLFKGFADPAGRSTSFKGGALKGKVTNSYQRVDLTSGAGPPPISSGTCRPPRNAASCPPRGARRATAI